mmetsp:Transcript_63/g.211  ORF Transcript_63/g.211 Transcript_63/m.211 type:complete len:313 (-) Transcript_63:976-1914(-)
MLEVRQIDLGPLVRSHGNGLLRKRNRLVQVVAAGCERVLKVRQIGEKLRVRVLGRRHLLQDDFDLVALRLRELAAHKLRLEAICSRHDGLVEVFPAGHEEGVNFLAHAFVQSVELHAKVRVELEHVPVHLSERGAALGVGHAKKAQHRLQHLDAQVHGLHELLVAYVALDLVGLVSRLARLLRQPLIVDGVDHKLLQDIVHVAKADDHHHLGREASLAVADELRAAFRPRLLRDLGSELAVASDGLLVVAHKLDDVPNVGDGVVQEALAPRKLALYALDADLVLVAANVLHEVVEGVRWADVREHVRVVLLD